MRRGRKTERGEGMQRPESQPWGRREERGRCRRPLERSRGGRGGEEKAERGGKEPATRGQAQERGGEQPGAHM
eukprot:7249193-Prorocentrum_lima.AAC.1